MGDMQEDLERNLPSSKVSFLGVNETTNASGNQYPTSLADIPWLQDVDANQNNISDLWYDRWHVTFRDVWILDTANELAGVYNLTTHDLGDEASYDTLRQMIVDVATADRDAGSAWQNGVEPMDVSGDGFVVPNDVLRVINRINNEGAGELPTPGGPISSYVDVTGDNYVSSLDALRVIRHLNRYSITGAGEPDDRIDLGAAAAALSADALEPVADTWSNETVEVAPQTELKMKPARKVMAAKVVDLCFDAFD